jgi:hypothetical protein
MSAPAFTPSPYERSDFRLSFVHAATGRPFTWRTPDGRSYTADTTCSNTTRERVEDRCRLTLPMIARSAGVPVTAIEGRIVELEPKIAADPVITF